MEILKELASVITKNKIKSVQILGQNTSPDSIIERFYKGIQEGKFNSDAEAEDYFYEKGNKAYPSLKSKLKKKLLNMVYFIDVNKPRYTNISKAFYSAWRDFAAAKILMGKGAYLSSTELLEKILNQSIKYEFPELAKEVARELMRYNGVIKGDEKKMHYYDDLFYKYNDLANAEAKAEVYYTRLVTKYRKRKDKNVLKEIQKESQIYYNNISPYLLKFEANKLHLLGRLIELLLHKSVNDYQKALSTCKSAIVFFEKKQAISTTSIQLFLSQALVIYIILKDFENGKEVVVIGEEVALGNNWFSNRKLHFLLCTHSKEYQEAYTTLHKVQTHELYKRLPEHLSESWRVYEAYTHYLIAISKIQANGGKKYRIGKFLNEVPAFSKDKKGMNIPILIIQILFLIHQGKSDAAIDRIESLQSYGSRNIRKDENFRTNCFIKMLAQLPKAGFRAKRLLRHADKYHAKLLTMPIHEADQAFEIEVIPYEDLWGLVVESLG